MQDQREGRALFLGMMVAAFKSAIGAGEHDFRHWFPKSVSCLGVAERGRTGERLRRCKTAGPLSLPVSGRQYRGRMSRFCREPLACGRRATICSSGLALGTGEVRLYRDCRRPLILEKSFGPRRCSFESQKSGCARMRRRGRQHGRCDAAWRAEPCCDPMESMAMPCRSERWSRCLWCHKRMTIPRYMRLRHALGAGPGGKSVAT